MKLKLFIVALFCSVVSFGQFNINTGGTNYTQDFNTLTSGAWSNNTTLSGWYARTTATATITTYAANTGTSTAAALYAFGVAGTNPLSDRGLGWGISNAFTGAAGTGRGYVGWRLRNNTGSNISSITVTWSGEQWRRDNTVNHNLNLNYQTGATITDLIAGTWTSVTPSFNSLQNGTSLALDGNAPVNTTIGLSVTISVTILPGEEIMLRWDDLNDSGNDHLMAIDDVTINATTSVSSVDYCNLQSPANGTITEGGTLMYMRKLMNQELLKLRVLEQESKVG